MKKIFALESTLLGRQMDAPLSLQLRLSQVSMRVTKLKKILLLFVSSLFVMQLPKCVQ